MKQQAVYIRIFLEKQKKGIRYWYKDFFHENSVQDGGVEYPLHFCYT